MKNLEIDKNYIIFLFSPYIYAVMIIFKYFNTYQLYATTSLILLYFIKKGYKSIEKLESKQTEIPIMVDIATMLLVLSILFNYSYEKSNNFIFISYIIEIICHIIFVITYLDIQKYYKTLNEKKI